MLEEAIDNIRGAVMIGFPQGLPEWDLVRQALEGTEELAGTSVSPVFHCCTLCCKLCVLLVMRDDCMQLLIDARVMFTCSVDGNPPQVLIK